MLKGSPIFAIALIAGAGVASAQQQAWAPYLSGTVRDKQGNAYFVGFLGSDLVPVTAGAFQTKFNAETCGYVYGSGKEYPVPCRHGFAIKVSPDGKTVLYATYLESSGVEDDVVYPVGVDASGDLFVLVATSSLNTITFPQTGTINGLPPLSGPLAKLHPEAVARRNKASV